MPSSEDNLFTPIQDKIELIDKFQVGIEFEEIKEEFVNATIRILEDNGIGFEEEDTNGIDVIVFPESCTINYYDFEDIEDGDVCYRIVMILLEGREENEHSGFTTSITKAVVNGLFEDTLRSTGLESNVKLISQDRSEELVAVKFTLDVVLYHEVVGDGNIYVAIPETDVALVEDEFAKAVEHALKAKHANFDEDIHGVSAVAIPVNCWSIYYDFEDMEVGDICYRFHIILVGREHDELSDFMISIEESVSDLEDEMMSISEDVNIHLVPLESSVEPSQTPFEMSPEIPARKPSQRPSTNLSRRPSPSPSIQNKDQKVPIVVWASILACAILSLVLITVCAVRSGKFCICREI